MGGRVTGRRLEGGARSRTAHEYVRQVLRAAILDGTLGSGERLLQTELAEQLAVSTTPVREALRDLASEGLVVFDPHRGALVRTLDIADVREVYELRMTLEPLMVRRVVDRLSDDQLDRARELQRTMAETTDMGEWSDQNRRFHAVFHEPDAGTRLAGVLAGLRDTATPYVRVSLGARPQQVPQANLEHAQLVDLFLARDVDGIVELTVQHLRATLAAIEESQQRFAPGRG